MDTDELRNTLTEHADFTDEALAARVGSVHGRVRVVRRRRRAALTGAVAAAVLIGVAGVTVPWPSDEDAGPAGRELLGMTAPGTFVSADTVFAYDRGVTGLGTASLELEPSDRPRLVSWAVEGPDDTAEVTPTSDAGWTSTSEDFGDFLRIEAGETGTLSVAAEGKGVALALYDLAALPKGPGGNGFVFRTGPAGDRLIASAIGEPGQTELETSFEMPATQLAWGEVCFGASGYEVHVDVAGSGAVIISCDAEAPHDPVLGVTGVFVDGMTDARGRRLVAGDEVTVRTWVARKGSNEPVREPVPGLNVGVAFYEKQPSLGRLAGHDLYGSHEHRGHAYELHEDVESAPGAGSLTVQVDATDGPVLVLAAGSGRGDLVMEVSGDEVMGHFSETGAPFGALDHVVHSGVATVVVRYSHPTAQARVAIASYRRLDRLR